MPLDHTGKYRIRNKETGYYLVFPVGAWGEFAPVWDRIPEAAFRFSKSHARDQANFLAWDHKIKSEITLSLKIQSKV